MDKLAEAKATREAEKLLKKAEKVEDPEEKAELEEQAEEVYVAPNIASGSVQKSSSFEGGGGTTFVNDIQVDIVDEYKLLKEILNGNVPMTVFEFKPAKLKAWVKVNAVKNGQVEGIKIIEVKRESVRSR